MIINFFKYIINLFRHKAADFALAAPRSPHWHTLQKHFLESHPKCESCGSAERLNVHHVKPFHLHPELELDPNNLITLCMSGKECHLLLGHGGDFKAFCPNVREYIEKIHKKEYTFNQIVIVAKGNRKYK